MSGDINKYSIRKCVRNLINELSVILNVNSKLICVTSSLNEESILKSLKCKEEDFFEDGQHYYVFIRDPVPAQQVFLLFENETVALRTEEGNLIYKYGWDIDFDDPITLSPERVNLIVRLPEEAYVSMRRDLIDNCKFYRLDDELEEIQKGSNIDIFWLFFNQFIGLLDIEVVSTVIALRAQRSSNGVRFTNRKESSDRTEFAFPMGKKK